MNKADIEHGIGLAIKKAEEDAVERADNMSEVLIFNKENGELVERYLKYPDEAERFAKSKIWGRKYLKYQIITVVL